MKFKYFLRGLGVGILFTAVISILSLKLSGKSVLTTGEIIERAEEMGMVTLSEAEKMASESEEEEETEPAAQESTVTETLSPEDADVIGEGVADDILTEETAVDEASSDNEMTILESDSIYQDGKMTTESVTDEGSVVPETEAVSEENSGTYVDVDIKKGMWSEDVAAYLETIGAIDDADEFNDYLCENGYSSNIVVGKYSIDTDSSYEDIAKQITRE